jgi:hypothetical protein
MSNEKIEDQTKKAAEAAASGEEAKAEDEAGLSEDELEGVSGGAGVGPVVRPRVAATGLGGAAVAGVGGVLGKGGIASEHVKTGTIFPKGTAASNPGSNSSQ